MIPVLFVISLSVALGGGIIQKYYTSKTRPEFFPLFFYNAVSGVVAAIVFLCWGGFGNPSVFTILLGLLFGSAIGIQSIATMLAYRTGPMSFTAIIISFSTVFTALSGAVFWNEKLKILQIIGIALMAVSFVFAVSKKDDEKGASWKWLLFCLIAFVCCGGIGLMQKIHQTSEHKDEINAFLITAFGMGSVFYTVFAVVLKIAKKKTLLAEGEKIPPLWIIVVLIVFAGGFAAVNHKLNLYLSGVIDSAVFFPVVNGGGLVLTTLAALFLFRERLTVKQWFGVIFGITSVLCLCL